MHGACRPTSPENPNWAALDWIALGGAEESGKKALHIPAPVTSATLPASDADASPRGPGISSYLLSPLGTDVTPGIVVGMVLIEMVGGAVVVGFENVAADDAGDWLLEADEWCWCCLGSLLVSGAERVGMK